MGVSEQTQPAFAIKVITPHATNPLDPRPRSIYVETDGTMAIENEDGSTETGITVVAGTTIPLQAYKVTAATATLYSLYY